MSYPGITSDSTHHFVGAGTTNAVISGAGILSALVASTDDAANIATVTFHDSLNIGTDPRPLLTIYLLAGPPVHICRPYAQGFYFSRGISINITATAGDPAVHFTTHVEVTP